MRTMPHVLPETPRTDRLQWFFCMPEKHIYYISHAKVQNTYALNRIRFTFAYYHNEQVIKLGDSQDLAIELSEKICPSDCRLYEEDFNLNRWCKSRWFLSRDDVKLLNTIRQGIWPYGQHRGRRFDHKDVKEHYIRYSIEREDKSAAGAMIEWGYRNMIDAGYYPDLFEDFGSFGGKSWVPGVVHPTNSHYIRGTNASK